MVDSNLWIYYADATVPEHPVTRDFLTGVLREEEVAVNTVIQTEVAHYLIRRLGSVAGLAQTRVFLGLDIGVDALDPSRVDEAVALLARYADVGIGGRDATVLATLRSFGTDRLATHDEGFRRVDWVRVEDPLARRGG
ncbi:MAG: type II toxin-antitoxin system VapC family toxin [Thermoplasmata archaeon]